MQMMTVYMLSLHFKTYIDEKENSGFCLAFTSLHAEIYFYRFLILFLLPKPHHTTTQAAKDCLEASENIGNEIWKNLPNLWNVLASSIGKSLTRTSKAPPTSAQNKYIFTAGENLFPLNFIKERVTGLGFLAAVAQNDNQ